MKQSWWRFTYEIFYSSLFNFYFKSLMDERNINLSSPSFEIFIGKFNLEHTKKNYICWKKVNFHNVTKQQSWEDTESNQNNIQKQEFPTVHFRFHSLTSWLEHWEECLIHHHYHHHHHPCHAHHEYHLHHHQDHLQKKRFWELIVNFTGKCF